LKSSSTVEYCDTLQIEREEKQGIQSIPTEEDHITPTRHESSKSKWAETREFWEEAVRLWADSGLSVREFCAREGLAEHTFYSRRRELRPEIAAPEIGQVSSGANEHEAVTDGRPRRKRKQATADDLSEVAAPFVELVASPSAGLCHCTLELENTDGAKMRIQLRSTAMPDLAAISQSFWNHC
jgi:transposase-like protein